MTEDMVELRLRIPAHFARATGIWHAADRMCAKSFPEHEDAVEAIKEALMALLCDNCDGAGHTGAKDRPCPDCGGTGWTDGVSPIIDGHETKNEEVPEGARWADGFSPPWFYRVRDGRIELCNSFDKTWAPHESEALLRLDFMYNEDACWVLDHYAEERAWRRLEE